MMFNGAGSRKLVKKKRWPVVLIIVLIAILVIVAGFFAWKYFSNKGESTDEAATQKIISKVNELYLTPEGEEPTVALIQDKEALNGQVFFDKAQNGDYLLIYSSAQVAIIYREDLNKLINVGPISTSQPGEGEVGGAATQIQPEP